MVISGTGLAERRRYLSSEPPPLLSEGRKARVLTAESISVESQTLTTWIPKPWNMWNIKLLLVH
eukprot:UN14677